MRSAIRGVAFLAFVAFGGGPAFADGPVTPGALPGGVDVTDNDTGNGQRWGRAGGRTITYSISSPANFSALSWGVVSGTNPSLAFDGAVTPSTTEILSFTPGQSNLDVGMARWTGSAQLPLLNGSEVTIPTRFTLTVTSGELLPLSFVSGGVNPGADVLAASPFTVNLLFEMQYITALPGGDNTWRPVLDLYDSLPNTVPGQPPSTNVGPVMTGVTTGFYFTASTGMTIAEHDVHITDLLGPIASDVAFLKIEVPSRLQGLGTDAVEIKNKINEILGQLGGSGRLATSTDVDAARNAVDAARNALQEILLILFGLFPCPPEAGPLCTTAKFVKDLSTQASVDAVRGQTDAILAALTGVQTQLGGLASQSSVDTVKTKVEAVQDGVSTAHVKLDALQGSLDFISGAGLDVQVSRVDTKSKNLRWLVKTTRDGMLVNATLAQLVSIRTSSPTAVAQDVLKFATVVPVAIGLHDVSLNVVKGVTDGSAYLFEVEAQLVDAQGVIKGSALVGTEKHDEE